MARSLGRRASHLPAPPSRSGPGFHDRPALLLLAALLALLAGPAGAQSTDRPLDLSDPTPRWVDVAFELSPRDAPGRLDAAWSPRLRAWLQPADLRRKGWVLVALPAPAAERLFTLGEERPAEGSFSDFVWVFDAASGHVVSAEVTGALYTRVGWGFLGSDARVEFRAVMSTAGGPRGFRSPFFLLGQSLFRVCEPAEAERDDDCTLVAPVPLQPHTGYVNAVGEILATGHGITTRSFSSLGEARFFETPAPGPPAVASAPPP